MGPQTTEETNDAHKVRNVRAREGGRGDEWQGTPEGYSSARSDPLSALAVVGVKIGTAPLIRDRQRNVGGWHWGEAPRHLPSATQD